MTTRNNKTLGHQEAWQGDLWKLVHIFTDAGMTDNISLLSSASSGIFAVLNPGKKIITTRNKFKSRSNRRNQETSSKSKAK